MFVKAPRSCLLWPRIQRRAPLPRRFFFRIPLDNTTIDVKIFPRLLGHACFFPNLDRVYSVGLPSPGAFFLPIAVLLKGASHSSLYPCKIVLELCNRLSYYDLLPSLFFRFARRRFRTCGGTKAETSPPMEAISRIRLEDV